MLRKALEYIIIFTGAILLANEEPLWCIIALSFVFIDIWDLVVGYREFKKHIRSTTIQIPKNASEKEKKEILDKEIKKLLKDE